MAQKAYIPPKPRPRPEQYDSPLRYWVWSRTTEEKYLVQFDMYDFNGFCTCADFGFNLEKFLKNRIKPEDAVAQKLIKLRPGRRVQDAFRCQHICDALIQWGEDAARVASHDQKTRSTATPHPTQER